ncbi:MAG TPA: zf-HC2 domain-containing protein [Streptosporangiaceae bacterium]|nr:zf-HC2 domain-containing protein [Streptosporangiaceae bacterium]
MTVTGASGPACRDVRLLLGVYVVGAIDPAERAEVDEHLSECQACRDELAGLAGLPAMLGRVPAADVARMDESVTSLPAHQEPSPELLDSLLKKVAGRRRTRMWRGVAAVAAAAVIAAGGTAVALEATSSPAGHGRVWSSASGTNAADHVAAVVDYTRAAGNGTDMRVQASGISPGTTCKFWVISGNGPVYAGTWTVEASLYGLGNPWYSEHVKVAPGSVRGFQITAGGKALVTIPAA